MDKKLNVNQAAAYLGIRSSTLWEWRKRSIVELPYYLIGKRKLFYLQSDLDNYLAQCRIDTFPKIIEGDK